MIGKAAACDMICTKTMADAFVWDGSDCFTMFADQVIAVRGFDPISQWRGCYSDAHTAKRLAARHGGLVAALSGVMAARSVAETHSPAHGDVAVIGTDDGPVCALIGDGEAICRMETRGVMLVSLRCVEIAKAWSL